MLLVYLLIIFLKRGCITVLRSSSGCEVLDVSLLPSSDFIHNLLPYLCLCYPLFICLCSEQFLNLITTEEGNAICVSHKVNTIPWCNSAAGGAKLSRALETGPKTAQKKVMNK